MEGSNDKILKKVEQVLLFESYCLDFQKSLDHQQQ